MNHLFVCREYPPAAYPPGGIGTYVHHVATLLARSGDTVHVIAHRWHGASEARHVSVDGRLVVHRVALDEASTDAWSRADASRAGLLSRALLRSSLPSLAFAWQATLVAEQLMERERIDVIEGQEWEAPLYFVQLRRLLGLGPSSRPPCIVHLHSSTEQIFAANGWKTDVVDYAAAAAVEEFSIEKADAVLCPSRFMADAALRRYRIDPARLHVIPYPLGEVPRVDREVRAWASPAMCHVGRLEPRKGVLELVDAIGLLDPGARPEVHFIGDDVPLGESGGPFVGDVLRGRAPADVRSRLHFHGTLPRPDVFRRLSDAFALVVPSRWDNLPNSCLEAMATGLPIIASPSGGMKEIISDGVSGWIASDSTPTGIADALRRALATPPAQRAAMGRAAQDAVRLACGNDAVIRQHRELKARLIAAQPAGSASTAAMRVTALAADSNGIRAARELIESDSTVPAVAFVDGGVSLDPECLVACADLLERVPEAGVVAVWTHDAPARQVSIPIRPEDAAPEGNAACVLVVRTTAIAASLSVDPTKLPDMSELLRTVQQAGWRLVAYPAVLATRNVEGRRRATPRSRRRYSSIARAVQRLHEPLLEWLLTCPPGERNAVIRGVIRNPSRSAQMVLSRVRRRRPRPEPGSMGRD